jgi:hypothetical protein
MFVWRGEVDGMGPGSGPVGGIYRFIYNYKPSVLVTASFYKLSVLKHKACAQLTSRVLLVSFYSFRKINTAARPNISLVFLKTELHKKLIKSRCIASTQINQQTNALCMVKMFISIT